MAYVIHGTSDAIVIDGGAVSEILSYLDKKSLTLKYIFNTHNHGDHTSGNNKLLQETGASFVSVKKLIDEKTVHIENIKIKIIPTPGHTDDSICFYVNDCLITGDTLFNGTVGNCFSHDEASFVNSLKTILTLPDHTIIYAGHDYVLPAMRFAKKHALNDKAVDSFLKTYDSNHVCSKLGQEKKHNIFLISNSPKIKALLQSIEYDENDEAQRFRALKEIEIWD
jgi:hydroxyacylglutathione hydrolase